MDEAPAPQPRQRVQTEPRIFEMDDWSDVCSSLSGTQKVPAESDAGKRNPTRLPAPAAFSLFVNPATQPPSELLDSIWVALIPSNPGAAPPRSNGAASAHNILVNDLASMVAPKIAGLSTSPLSISNVHSVAANAPKARDSRVVAAEEKAWKEINEKCGGRIRRYHEMAIEKINSGRNGVIIPPEAAITEKGELVGDRRPGYENMILTDKSFAWWTKKQMKIYNDVVGEEVDQATNHSAEADAQVLKHRPRRQPKLLETPQRHLGMAFLDKHYW